MEIKLFCKTFYYLVFNFNTASGILLVQPGVPKTQKNRAYQHLYSLLGFHYVP